MAYAFTNWPTLANVKAYVVSIGLLQVAPTNDDDTQLFLDTAIEEWNADTGWFPFLKQDSDAALYDPPEQGMVIELDNAYTTISEVKTGIDTEGNGGTVLTLDTQYLLRCFSGGPRLGAVPFTQIQFIGGNFGGGWRSIKVTGEKGWQVTLDKKVFLSVLEQASLKLAYRYRKGEGFATEVREGRVMYKFKSGTLQSDAINQDYWSVVGEYQRMVI
jgi:hypothetical protein